MRCRYCERENSVRTAKTLHPVTPPAWRPPETWTPPPHMPAASSALPYHRPSVSSAALAVFGVVGSLLALGVGGVAAFVTLSRSPQHPPPPRPVPGSTMPAAPEVALGGEPTLGAARPGEEPTTYTGTVRGEASLFGRSLGAECRGQVDRRPTLAVVTTGTSLVEITATASEAGTDLTLALRDASGTFRCDDDSGGSLNPRLAVALSAGTHELWVGSMHAPHAPAPFSLTVSAEALSALPLDNGLAPDAAPTLGAIDLDARPPGDLEGRTRSQVTGDAVGPSCRGRFPVVPHATIATSEPRQVQIDARGRADLTLLLHTADGTWACDDDSGRGHDPRLTTTLSVGTHQVWVGQYHAGPPEEFRLHVGRATARRGRRR